MLYWWIILGVLFVLTYLVGFWLLRPNTSNVDLGLIKSPREIINDGQHNGFTDLEFWQGYLYVVYVSSPSHFRNDHSKLVIKRSSNYEDWESVIEFRTSDREYRDPKLAVLKGKLFLFALLNKSFDPKPYGTIQASTTDGINWTGMTEIDPQGWLFGHPKTNDGLNWYVPAHNHNFDKLAIFKSEDGLDWILHSMVIEKKGVDESAVEFLTDGQMLVITRFENGSMIIGSDQNGTLILTSSYPFTVWASPKMSKIARLDGPTLFSSQGNIFAIGRSQPGSKIGLHKLGSILSKKRTSLFSVTMDGLTYISDLPSAGDTAYAGTITSGSTTFVSYYSSNFEKDYPWIIGMLLSTGIYLAEINLSDFAIHK